MLFIPVADILHIIPEKSGREFLSDS